MQRGLSTIAEHLVLLPFQDSS